jgi:hypothetical protein
MTDATELYRLRRIVEFNAHHSQKALVARQSANQLQPAALSAAGRYREAAHRIANR